MKQETLDKVLTLVSRANQAELRMVFDTAQYRSRELRAQAAEETKEKLQVGSEVRIKDTKPKYLNGLRGTVLDLHVPDHAGFIRVEFPHMPAQGLRRFGRILLMRPTQLVVMD